MHSLVPPDCALCSPYLAAQIQSLDFDLYGADSTLNCLIFRNLLLWYLRHVRLIFHGYYHRQIPHC